LPISHATASSDNTWIDHYESIRHFWLTFNRSLGSDTLNHPNETLLVQRLEALQDVEESDSPVFWLTVARLTELALKLAGDYADTCDFQAAGDLLVNPLQIDIYRRGYTVPIRKQRHGRLSEQFADAITDADPVAWLRHHTLPHIRTDALLPLLFRMLSASGVMAADYVASIDQRMRSVADAITFLSAWRISDYSDLQRRWKAAGAEDRELIVAHLCRFTLHRFAALGDDIERRLHHGDRYSQFLRPSKNNPMVPHLRLQDSIPHFCMP
jgi:hypothetical protein